MTKSHEPELPDPEIPDDLEPLFPNPGGIGSPDSLVGRERELARLQEAVVNGGAHVTGERRMGKTMLVKKLQDELSGTVTAIYVSAETSSVDLFGDRLLDALRKNRVISPRISRWEAEIGGEAKLSVGVFGITLHGKASRARDSSPAPEGLDVLDLLANAGVGPVVLIIDEITHLCHALGPDAAQELLSGLRSRRQSGGVPLVISGSIGLHHALHDLRSVNDLWVVQVGPLARDEAVVLAARLLLGIGVEPTPRLVARLLAETSSIPFYLHAVIDRLRDRADLDVEAVVEACLADDSWHTTHYVTRIREYYGVDNEEVVLTMLDAVAIASQPLRVDALLGLVQAADLPRRVTRRELIDLLDKLEKDHYLTRTGDGDRMSSPLLARIWRYHRRLS